MSDTTEIGRVQGSVQALVARLAYEEGTAEASLAELAISLATLVDVTTAKGSAVAGAQAGLQLRQTLDRIIELTKERDSVGDDFAELTALMLESVKANG